MARKLPKDILSRVKKEFIDDLKYFNYSLDQKSKFIFFYINIFLQIK